MNPNQPDEALIRVLSQESLGQCGARKRPNQCVPGVSTLRTAYEMDPKNDARNRQKAKRARVTLAPIGNR